MLETRYISKLGRSVTRLCLGALPMGPLQLKMSPREGAFLVRMAVEFGVTFIDTAAKYGTYEHIGRGLKGWKGTVTISTKTDAGSDRSLAKRHLEEARAALRRDTLDIVLCHCARSRFTEDEWGPTLEVLIAAREKGLVRMVGLSTHNIENVRIATRHPDLDVIHPLINMKGMGITDGTAVQMIEAIREAHKAGKFVYAMKAMAGGNLLFERRKALGFVFGMQEIDSVAVGMVTTAEVEWNWRFACGLPISEELSRRAAVRNKRVNILSNACVGCGECVTHCENGALSVTGGKAQVKRDDCVLCGYCAPHCERLAIRLV